VQALVVLLGLAGMLVYQGGLLPGAAVIALAVVIAVCNRRRLQLLGLTAIGCAAALEYIGLAKALGAACGSDYSPLRCSASSGPSVSSYMIAASALAVVGAALIALQGQVRTTLGLR
jgi:hypothetical protein